MDKLGSVFWWLGCMAVAVGFAVLFYIILYNIPI
jgi:hypothetical protein